MVSGLVQRFGSLGFIDDNTGCFGDTPFPRDGRFINFGAHEVFVATNSVCRFPEHVVTAADPPAVCAARGRHNDCPAGSVEVMMAGGNAAKDVAEGAGAPTKSTRTGRPPLERPEIGRAHV